MPEVEVPEEQDRSAPPGETSTTSHPRPRLVVSLKRRMLDRSTADEKLSPAPNAKRQRRVSLSPCAVTAASPIHHPQLFQGFSVPSSPTHSQGGFGGFPPLNHVPCSPHRAFEDDPGHPQVYQEPPPSPRTRLLDLDSLPYANRRLRTDPCHDRLAVVPLSSTAATLNPPPTASTASLSNCALAQRVVDELLRPGEWQPAPNDRVFFLTPTEVCQLSAAAKAAFLQDDCCVRCRAPSKIFGDVHGQFRDLLRLFDAYGAPRRGAGGDLALGE